jgi:putative hydrolase of HD superfamily
MAVLALTLENTKVNTTHCMKMSLVHDIGEAIVGDLTPR